MLKHNFLRKIALTERFFLLFRQKTTSSTSIQAVETESTEEVIGADDAVQRREEEIELKRNKSRLKEHDRNFLHERNPYPEDTFWHHGTIKYKRRLYGRYGEASNVDPQLCWPLKEEVQETIHYEQVKYPNTVPEMMKAAERLRFEKNERRRLRQEDIAKKAEKIEIWEKELHNKIAKKENEALAAKVRKERLLEEVRMHFGYTVDPKDEKFKEMVEKKEKEQKKVLKEARKKEREEMFLNKMLSKKQSTEKQEKPNEKEDQ